MSCPGYSKYIEVLPATQGRKVIRLVGAQTCSDRTGKRRRLIASQPGFTLIELMMVIAIIGILATLALGSYFTYVIHGQAARAVSSYDNIRTIVRVEAQAYGRPDLQSGSTPGEVPPALARSLDRVDFNQAYSTTLQLVKAPAGTFAGFPAEDVYALMATTSNARIGQYFLRVLRAMLPHSEGDKLWLSESTLYFPLDPGPGGDTSTTPGLPAPPPVTPEPVAPLPVTPTAPPIAPPSPPGGGSDSSWDNTETKNNGSTWDAQSRVCLNGSDGAPLSSDLNAQVQVRIVQEVRTWDGQTTERSWLTQVPIINGCASISLTGSPIGGPGAEGVSGLRFEIIDVNYYWPTDPAIKWDGQTPPLHISAPS